MRSDLAATPAGAAPTVGLLIVCAALMWAVAPAAGAGPSPEAPHQIKVGALRNWPPHYVADAKDRAGGFAIDVMNAVAARANLRVDYVLFDSFIEMQAALVDGRIDVIPNYGITEERRGAVDFTPPVETFAITLFVRAQTTDIHSIDDLPGHRVAVVESNAAVKLLADRGVDTRTYPEVGAALFDLLAGRVDALVYPSSVLWARARQAGVDDHLRVVGAPLAEIKRAMAVRAGHHELLAELATAVDELVGTAEFQAIYRRWHGHPAPFWTVGRVVWVTGLVLGAVLVLVVVWRFRVVTVHNRVLRERVAERDAAQSALAASEAQYRRIVETAGEGVWAIDAEGRTTFANPRMAAMLGLEPADMRGRPMFDFFDEELRAAAEANLQRRRAGIVEHHAFTLQRADGAQIDVVMAASPIFEDGEFRGALAMVSDVSDRRRLEAQLDRSQRFEALGRLAGGVAHDFNNLLVVINAAVALVRRALPADHPTLDDLSEISQASARGQALTSQLLAFSRRQVTHPQVLRPAARIHESHMLLLRLLGEDVTLTGPDRDAGGAVTIDPVQLDQIVFNLVSNARDALPDGGRVELAVADRTVGSDTELAPGDYVVLSVSDDGAGIAPDVLPHVFEPFFTTKAEGEGTGLGLATCYGIVTQARGKIDVTSQPGHGTTFEVWLPRAQAEAALVDPATAPSAAAHRRTILLVEDEDPVRRMVQRMLAADHQVLAAASPSQALALCHQHAEQLDVLLTDIVMPEMNGRELARKVRAVVPGLRVIYMSGYAERVLRDVAELDGGESFLPKPFALDDLLAAVARS